MANPYGQKSEPRSIRPCNNNAKQNNWGQSPINLSFQKIHKNWGQIKSLSPAAFLISFSA